jgi:hypothetical protein
LKEEFNRLLAEWRKDARPWSSILKDRMEHPAYLKIIALGWRVVPLILAELKKEPEPWFTALEAITRENPIQKSDQGRIQNMANAWLQWGREREYID